VFPSLCLLIALQKKSGVSWDTLGRTRCSASRGRPPYAPIRGLPRAWTALGLRDPQEGPQGPAARG